MHYLHIVCRCGHSAEVPWHSPNGVARADILRRARCSRCGAKAAVDMRLIWVTEANAMDGTRSQND